MKKQSFYLFAALLVAGLGACKGDGTDCDLKGKWKVKSADVSSEKLNSSVVEMAKDMMMRTTYNFTADSITIESGEKSVFHGTYAVDPAGDALSWKTMGGINGDAYDDNMKIVSCNDNEVTLLSRSPSDTTKAALTTTTIVIERLK